jgi:hypothetical protein
LGVVPPLVLEACKKEVVIPPTIVTGKVTDESGLPVDGVEFLFFGIEKQDLFREVHTFDEKQTTNKDGIYKFTISVPLNTQEFSLKVQSIKNPIANNGIIIFIQDNSIWKEYFDIIKVIEKSIVKETVNTINFQLRKP